MKIKSQISVEFIMVVSVVLIVFLVIFSIANKRNDILESQQTKLYAKQLAEKVAININSVFLAGPETNITISLPSSLKDESSYTLSIHPENHIVNIDYVVGDTTNHYATTILTSDISGTLTGISSSISISNQQEGIVIE
tara:strand:+ start:252 stop:668 length:417 start_codon:yes stop_codon:yes gene_type:complete